MPIFDQKCKTCAWEAEIWAKAGEHPPCPSCGSETERLWRSSAFVIGDDPFIGGKTFETMGHEPVTVYSRAEYKAAMARNNVEPFVRHQPLQGSDKSPHTVDWSRGSIDPQTLKNAQELLSRKRDTKPSEPTEVPCPVTFEWTDHNS